MSKIAKILNNIKTKNRYFDIYSSIKLGKSNGIGSITKLCEEQGISRNSYYRFDKVYKKQGRDGFAALIQNKYKLNKHLSINTEKKIIFISYKDYSLGKTRIQRKLQKKGIKISVSAIAVVFKRYNLRTKAKRNKIYSKYKVFAELWIKLKKNRVKFL